MSTIQRLSVREIVFNGVLLKDHLLEVLIKYKGVTCHSHFWILTDVSNKEGQGTNLHYYYFYLICNLFYLVIPGLDAFEH